MEGLSLFFPNPAATPTHGIRLLLLPIASVSEAGVLLPVKLNGASRED